MSIPQTQSLDPDQFHDFTVCFVAGSKSFIYCYRTLHKIYRAALRELEYIDIPKSFASTRPKSPDSPKLTMNDLLALANVLSTYNLIGRRETISH